MNLTKYIQKRGLPMSDSLYTIKKLYARYSLTDEHPGIFARRKTTDRPGMYVRLFGGYTDFCHA